MILLTVIADDFTGALDTGVQLAAAGFQTRVLSSAEAFMEAAADAGNDAFREDAALSDAEVLVINTDSRHLAPEAAYDAVFRAASRAFLAGVPMIYKKTDSALRGNAGAELAALLQASGEKQLSFVPAFPKMKRITKDGIHYIDGVPVADSVFGQDPFDPVRCSSVREILASGTALPVRNVRPGADADPAEVPEILVYDAASEEDFLMIADRLKESGKTRVLAGCAGFAAYLPALIRKGQMPYRTTAAQHAEAAGSEGPAVTEALSSAITKDGTAPLRLLVVSGSINPITLAQLCAGEAAGFYRIRLRAEEKLDSAWMRTEAGGKRLQELLTAAAAHEKCILDAGDGTDTLLTAETQAKYGLTEETLRTRITASIGALVTALLPASCPDALMITGGDTLLACMDALGIHTLEPVRELFPGVVLSHIRYQGRSYALITKSGGFGSEDLLEALYQKLSGQSLPAPVSRERRKG